MPLRRVFTVTGALVTLLAAGLAAQAMQQLSNAGLINVLDRPLWDSSWLLAENSWVGRVLHVLIGYMDRPTGAELLAYVLTAGGIVLLASWPPHAGARAGAAGCALRDQDLVHVAPLPVFARLERLNDRVLGAVECLVACL